MTRAGLGSYASHLIAQSVGRALARADARHVCPEGGLSPPCVLVLLGYPRQLQNEVALLIRTQCRAYARERQQLT
jgi:hypothetical protein